MARKHYQSKDGYIKITKNDDIPVIETPVVMQMNDLPKDINADDFIKAAFSYMTNGLEITGGLGEQYCKICGKKTSYNNRFICPDCWKKYKDTIFNQLNDFVSEKKVMI